MTTPEQRLAMAEQIVDFEGRRDNKGRLKVYMLPPGDGGGTYEVAGINDRYHPTQAASLRSLIEAKKYDEAEARAREYIAEYTDGAAKMTSFTAAESYLRDCWFNRGPRGCAMILQRAVGVKPDGAIGPITRQAVAAAEARPRELLRALRRAREDHERYVVGRDETSPFWKGLERRWNEAVTFAETFLTSESEAETIGRNLDPKAEFLTFDDVAPEVATTETNSPTTFDAAAAVVSAMSATNGATPAPATPAALGGTAPMSFLSAPRVLPSTQVVGLRAMRIGSTGDLVAAWQSFLLGKGLDPGGNDGYFGDKTEAATKAFQARNGLTADGIAGRQTLMKAMEAGFELIEEPASDITGSNYPPRPGFPPILTNEARQELFGRYDYVSAPVPGNQERIRIIGDWEAKNIIFVDIPQMRTALGPTAPTGMRFHRLAAAQLKGLWAAWEAAGLLSRIRTYEGAFEARFVRGSTTTLSPHAFGSAFDINAEWNWIGERPALVGQKGAIRELVPLANEWGFYWGGHFGTRFDGMHFEIAQLR